MSSDAENAWFRGLFGVIADVCAVAWSHLAGKLPHGGEPLHLLWALLFLKVYATESVHETLCAVDRKTFRKWSWNFIHLLADIKVIYWEKTCGSRIGNALMSDDGTDFRVSEPYPFDPKWYSHKSNGPGLRYEVGVSIRTGDIVWVNGSFPCGSRSNVRIFRLNMKQCLDQGEFVVADGGYSDERL